MAYQCHSSRLKLAPVREPEGFPVFPLTKVHETLNMQVHVSGPVGGGGGGVMHRRVPQDDVATTGEATHPTLPSSTKVHYSPKEPNDDSNNGEI